MWSAPGSGAGRSPSIPGPCSGPRRWCAGCRSSPGWGRCWPGTGAPPPGSRGRCPSPWPGTAWWGRGPPTCASGAPGRTPRTRPESPAPSPAARPHGPGRAGGRCAATRGAGGHPRQRQPLRPAQQPLRLGAPLQAPPALGGAGGDRGRGPHGAPPAGAARGPRRRAGAARGPRRGARCRTAWRSPAAPTRGPCAGPAGASGSACAGSPWRAPATWRGWTRSGPEGASQTRGLGAKPPESNELTLSSWGW